MILYTILAEVLRFQFIKILSPGKLVFIKADYAIHTFNHSQLDVIYTKKTFCNLYWFIENTTTTFVKASRRKPPQKTKSHIKRHEILTIWLRALNNWIIIMFFKCSISCALHIFLCFRFVYAVNCSSGGKIDLFHRKQDTQVTFLLFCV